MPERIFVHMVWIHISVPQIIHAASRRLDDGNRRLHLHRVDRLIRTAVAAADAFMSGKGASPTI